MPIIGDSASARSGAAVRRPLGAPAMSPTAATPPATGPTPPAKAPTLTPKQPEDPPAFSAAMKKGSQWARKRKHPKAIIAYKAALGVVPDHPEALYRLALSQMASKNKVAAVQTLARIRGSKSPRAAEWRVEARFDLVFKSLRGDSDFRKAVGIERGPDDPPTLYEKLVAFGLSEKASGSDAGRWT